MMPQEQVIFTDHAVYISNNRLVLRKGGTYPLANLAQVTFGRAAGSRSWIGFLIFGLIFLALGAWLNQNPTLATYGILLTAKPYLVIGGVLFLIGFVSAVFQIACPLYVVVLKGTFGTAQPLKRRNKRYILTIVTALNEAMSKRDAPSIVTNIGQLIQDSSSHSYKVNLDHGAQANIGTSGYAQNVRQASDPGWPDPNFSANNLHAFSAEARVDLPASVLDQGGTSGRTDQPRAISVPPGLTEAGTRKIIISYSHQDRQWLNPLRTHLAILEQQQMIALWDDTQIAAGMQMQQTMAEALKAADFALLLVSANFLASATITRYELPQIFQRLSQGRFAILPLLLSPCLYHESPLGGYQPFNPDSPLSTLSSPAQDEVLVRVAREIRNAVS